MTHYQIPHLQKLSLLADIAYEEDKSEVEYKKYASAVYQKRTVSNHFRLV